MENQQNDLTAIVDGLFANTVSEFTTENGTHVLFKRAGIVQLGQATKFFSLITERADPAKIKQLIDLITMEQEQMIAEGKSVHEMNLNAMALITKGLNNQSLLLTVFSAMADAIPEFVAIFTTISPEAYGELSLDEQLVIAMGIFAVNYGFFTQSLRPIIESAIRGLKQKQSANGKQQVASIATKSPAKKAR